MKAQMTFDVQLVAVPMAARTDVIEKCREFGEVLAASKARVTVGLEAEARDALRAGFVLATTYHELADELNAALPGLYVSSPKSMKEVE